MQKPWGRTVPGVLEEQRGGPFGWSRESKGERERGKGQVVQGLVGCKRTWVFALGKVGALEGCGQSRSSTLVGLAQGRCAANLLNE